MRFTTFAIAVLVGAAAPLAASAFVSTSPALTVQSKVVATRSSTHQASSHTFGCKCPSCSTGATVQRQHNGSCNCPACAAPTSRLQMVSGGTVRRSASKKGSFSSRLQATMRRIESSSSTQMSAHGFGVSSLTRQQHPASHSAACPCPSCNGRSQTTLRMSEEAVAEKNDEPAAEEEEIPAEVVALDGIDSEEEAHNVNRPERGSGIQKHKRQTRPGKPVTDFKVGEEVSGKVKTITSYGAFLDIGAQSDALLHVSRLSDDFVSNVEDVVKAGDKVTVRIVQINAEKGQVAVSMRSEEKEAEAAAQAQKPRQQRGGGGRRGGPDRAAQLETINSLVSAGFDDTKFVDGEVVSTLDFGAFVQFDAANLVESVAGKIDGLVHISALAAGRTDTVNSVVNTGDKVKVRVRSLDPEGGKVSLSMISKEDEAASRGGGDREQGDRPRRGRRPRWTEEEMGPKDWRDQLEAVGMPEFKNGPVIVDKRAR